MQAATEGVGKIPNGCHRRLATILTPDVKSFSRLMGEEEKWTDPTLDTFKGAKKAPIPQHDGPVVDYPGDNLLAELAGVVNAVKSSDTTGVANLKLYVIRCDKKDDTGKWRFLPAARIAPDRYEYALR